jgi:hypothetical protein
MNYLEHVKLEVEKVYRQERDNETAHQTEDALYEEVLRWIASGEISGEDAALCAKEALKTVDVNFERWFA